MRGGGTLVVWKFSRLARALTQMIQTVKTLEERDISLKVITQMIETPLLKVNYFFT